MWTHNALCHYSCNRDIPGVVLVAVWAFGDVMTSLLWVDRATRLCTVVTSDVVNAICCVDVMSLIVVVVATS